MKPTDEGYLTPYPPSKDPTDDVFPRWMIRLYVKSSWKKDAIAVQQVKRKLYDRLLYNSAVYLTPELCRELVYPMMRVEGQTEDLCPDWTHKGTSSLVLLALLSSRCPEDVLAAACHSLNPAYQKEASANPNCPELDAIYGALAGRAAS